MISIDGTENIDFEILEHEDIDGRIFLQFFSGELTNQFKIECLNRLCSIHTRMKLSKNGVSTFWEKQEFCLERAKTVTLDPVEDGHTLQHQPPRYLQPVKSAIIKAQDFPDTLPVNSISLLIVNGMFVTQNNRLEKGLTKNVTLIKAFVEFKSLDAIHLPHHVATEYSIDEVLFDKLTLFRSRVTIPRPFNYNVDVYMDVGSPATSCSDNSSNRSCSPNREQQQTQNREKDEDDNINNDQDESTIPLMQRETSTATYGQLRSRLPSAAPVARQRPDKGLTPAVSYDEIIDESSNDSSGCSNSTHNNNTLSSNNNNDNNNDSSSYRLDEATASMYQAKRALTLSRTERVAYTRIVNKVVHSNSSIETFIFFLVMLMWLIYRSYYLTNENYHRFTWYSVGFGLTSGVVIWSFRGHTLRVLRKIFAKPESNGRTFFVNGWNAWSFCGCVLQGSPAPRYSMPSVFVRAFHDGGVGASLSINLGHGTGPAWSSADNTPHADPAAPSPSSSTPPPSPTSANRMETTPQMIQPKGSPSSPSLQQSTWTTDPVEKKALVDTYAEKGMIQCLASTTSSSSSSSNNSRVQYSLRSIWQTMTEYCLPTWLNPWCLSCCHASMREFQRATKDYVASDMFTILADNRAQYGVVVGFLSQRRQFGCIAVNRNYDRMSVHISGDGTLIPPKHGTVLETDWLSLYTVNSLVEPFKVYMKMSSLENCVSNKLSYETKLQNNQEEKGIMNNSDQAIHSKTRGRGLFPENDQDEAAHGSDSSHTSISSRWYNGSMNTIRRNSQGVHRKNAETEKTKKMKKHAFGKKKEVDVEEDVFADDEIEGDIHTVSDDEDIMPGGEVLRNSSNSGNNNISNNYMNDNHDDADNSTTMSWDGRYRVDSPRVQAEQDIVLHEQEQEHDQQQQQQEALSGHPQQLRIPAGWCSWYHFYESISELNLVENLTCMQQQRQKNAISSERQAFQLFQIDDGYQSAWGDWTLVNGAKFPTKSLYSIVRKIKEAKLTPGLWLAPFSCDKHSEVGKQHPEWILKRNGSASIPSNSANCGKFFYGLDTTHPGVQSHVRTALEVATSVWGFTYLKLDFLYSAVLADAHDSHHDRTLTNAQIMHQAMQLVNDVVGPRVTLLGCGAPLGALVGHVHANRVSADAGLAWNPDMPLPQGDQWNLPCARNCVRNTLNRLFIHGEWWINDPDCVMLRDKLCFTHDEIQGIATAKALSGGSFIVSDDLQQISPERFRIAVQLLPPSNQAAIALDLLEREMPETFRLHLNSNYMRWLLTADAAGVFDEEDDSATAAAAADWGFEGVTGRLGTGGAGGVIPPPPPSPTLMGQDSSYHYDHNANRSTCTEDSNWHPHSFYQEKLKQQQEEEEGDATVGGGQPRTGNDHDESHRRLGSGEVVGILHMADDMMIGMENPQLLSTSSGFSDTWDSNATSGTSRRRNTNENGTSSTSSSPSSKNSSSVHITSRDEDREMLSSVYSFNSLSSTENNNTRPASTTTTTTTNTTTTLGVNNAYAASTPPPKKRPSMQIPVNLGQLNNNNNSNNNNHSSSSNSNMGVKSPPSVKCSPQIARKHVRSQQENIFKMVGSDLDLLQSEKKNVRTFLMEEDQINEDDLLREYTLITVCNWGNEVTKNHFLSIKTIFGEEYVDLLVSKKILLDNMIKLQQMRHHHRHSQRSNHHISTSNAQSRNNIGSYANNNYHYTNNNNSHIPGRDVEKELFRANRRLPVVAPQMLLQAQPQLPLGAAGTNTTITATTTKLGATQGGGAHNHHYRPVATTQLAEHPRYLLHMFNFWLETYTYKIVTLEEDQDSEVAFLNIPRHSAHIYSVSLTTDPTLPKYIGSNLHFSCGGELHRIHLSPTPVQAAEHLHTQFRQLMHVEEAHQQNRRQQSLSAVSPSNNSYNSQSKNNATSTQKRPQHRRTSSGTATAAVTMMRNSKSSSSSSNVNNVNTNSSHHIRNGSSDNSSSTGSSTGGGGGGGGGDTAGGAGAFDLGFGFGPDSFLPNNTSDTTTTTSGTTTSNVTASSQQPPTPSLSLALPQQQQQRAALTPHHSRGNSFSTTSQKASTTSSLTPTPALVEYTPVIRSMYVSFEPGALKDADWGGQVWVFLPVNGLNAALTRSCVGKIHISGSAWTGRLQSLQPVSNASSSLAGIGCEKIEAQEVQTVQLCSSVSAPDCKIEGGVYRIAVSRSSSSATCSASAPSGTETRASGGVAGVETAGGAREGAGSDWKDTSQQAGALTGNAVHPHDQQQQQQQRDYIIVSWIYDVIEKKNS